MVEVERKRVGLEERKTFSSVEQPAISPLPRVTHTPDPGRLLRINPRRKFPTVFSQRNAPDFIVMEGSM